MDSASLFLTANCDTVYFWGFIDLSDGPMVLDVPPLGAPSGLLGTIDDMWFRWVTDVGLPGPDRGAGGRYLLVGPGYDGPLPDSGFHVFHARTTRVTLIGRGFMVDNDPKVPVEAIRNGVRVSPYVPGTAGHRGRHVPGRDRRRWGQLPAASETRFVEASGKVVQHPLPQRLRLLGARRRAGAAGATGSRRSGAARPARRRRASSTASRSSPTQRMRRILEEAVVVGNATARTVTFARRDPRKASPTTRTRHGQARSSSAATSSSTRPRRSPPTARSPRPERWRPQAQLHAPTSSTWPPASPRRCACASPASARSTSTRCATATATTSTAPATIA